MPGWIYGTERFPVTVYDHEYRFDMFNGTPDEIIAKAQEIKEKWGPEIYLEFDREDGVTLYRPETDEEMNDRIAYYSRDVEAEDKKRRKAQYEELKKEFEDEEG
jgi:hypothetical protein